MLGDEVATYLANAGIGFSLVASTSATIIFAVPFPPEAQDAAACIIEYGGMPPLDAMGPSGSAPVFEQPRFQLLVRDRPDNLAACRSLMNLGYKALRHFSGVLSGVNYGFIQALSPVAFLKFDENNRGIYYANMEATKAES